MMNDFLDKNSARYLSAFNQIEKYLTEKLDGKIQSSRFNDKISRWQEMGYLSRRQLQDLKQIGKLRNALVHEYYDEEVIAEPSLKIVERIEQLREDICRPKRLHELFAKNIITVDLKDRIGSVLNLFWKNKISQIPVLEEDKIVDILNTNTISWWAAATNPDNLQDTRIKELLSYSEYKKNFEILDQNAKLPEAVRLFRESYSKVNKGWFMDAILITSKGRADSELKGIIVLEDLVDYLI
jgi:predicted transcriptional regulator